MKKLSLIILSLLATLMIIPSCKKDFTCYCTYKDVIGEPGTLTWEIEDARKKDAKDTCETYTFAGWSEIECTLE